MRLNRWLIQSIIVFMLFLTACNHKPSAVGFYYWKTSYKQDTLSNTYLSELKASKLYLRVMDIDYDVNQTQAIPIAPIQYADSLASQQEVVPVIFINQRIFLGLDSFAIRALAHKIAPFVTAKLAQGGRSSFQELQLDCDWTRSSRDGFFYLINFLKTIPAFEGVEITSTLRLHQVKNLQTAGVPPVNRVALMCYNMGNLRQFGNQNSILNQADLSLYLKDVLKTYPLEIDVALPLFQWFVVFRNNKYVGISKHISSKQLEDKDLFIKNPNSSMYVLKVDLPEAGLQKNDIIRHEFVSTEDLQATTKFLKKELKAKPANIIFYHLDPEVMGKFSYEELSQISLNL